jgi:hypothetical protein
MAGDQFRRDAECKLLHFQYQLLLVIPSTALNKREELQSKLLDLVNDMILLKIPVPLAWSIYVNTRNFFCDSDYNHIISEMQYVLPDSLDAKLGVLYRDFLTYIKEKKSRLERVTGIYDIILVWRTSTP